MGFYFTYTEVYGALSRWCSVVNSYQMTVQWVWIGLVRKQKWSLSFILQNAMHFDVPKLVFFNQFLWCVIQCAYANWNCLLMCFCLFVMEIFNIVLWPSPFSRAKLDFGLKL